MSVPLPPGSLPVALMLQHGPMVRTWLRLFLRALIGRFLPTHTGYHPVACTVDAPPRYQVAAYERWCGAPADPARVPAHLFSQWGLSPAMRIFEQSSYNLAEVINQGVSMRVLKPLPAGERLRIRASLESLRESGGATQVAVRIATGTMDDPERVIATLHSAFLNHGPGVRGAIVRPFRAASNQWDSAGTWSAEAGDGLQFALLTGDFNPIHWLDSAGRKSPFGRTVLQGLGMFVRTCEVLARHGDVAEIEARFLRPVPLPSGVMRVECAPSADEGWTVVRVVDAEDKVCLSGRFRRDLSPDQ